MLKKERQIKHFNKSWKSISGLINAFQNQPDPEIMHDLRVEIKQIRALLKFTTSCSETVLLPDDMEMLKKIFKHAGLIREAHVYIQSIEKNGGSIPDLKKQNETIISEQTAFFHQSTNLYRNYLSDFSIPFTTYFNDIPNSIIINYFENKIRKLQKFFRKDIKEDMLHNQRKRIKHLLFIEEILPASISKKINFNKKYFDHLQSLIGKWHDSIDAIELLSKNNLHGEQIIKQEILREKLLCDIKSEVLDFEKKSAL